VRLKDLDTFSILCSREGHWHISVMNKLKMVKDVIIK